MRLLTVLFLALAAGIGLTMIANKPGYVLISREPWSVETSFTVFVAGLLLLVGFSYLLLRLAIHVFDTPERIRRWQQQRHAKQAVEDTRKGLVELINGNFELAEKSLTRRLDDNPLDVISLLAAAWAAQQRDDRSARDEYLNLASKRPENSYLATGIITCQLQHQAGEHEESLNTARKLHEHYPASPSANRCLVDTLEQNEQWQDLFNMLNNKNRSNITSDHAQAELLSLAGSSLLSSANDLETTHTTWKSLPRKLRKDMTIVASYCRALARFSADAEAEELIRNSLKTAWSAELVEIYGTLKGEDPSYMLKQAEQWLADHPTDTQLMLCLGRLAIQNQLWGMARSYLEVAVQNGDEPGAFIELARLFESLDERDSAFAVYKRGLELSLDASSSTAGPGTQSDTQTEDNIPTSEDAVQRPSLAYSNESK
jgi:HemY protein